MGVLIGPSGDWRPVWGGSDPGPEIYAALCKDNRGFMPCPFTGPESAVKPGFR